MIAILFFVVGVTVGSFLNVVIFRSEREETFVTGRSKCLACNTLIHWYDNIPLLSFLFLQGKCRNCKSAISWQYPLVELVTGLYFLLVGTVFLDVLSRESWLEVVWLLLLGIFLLLIFVSDIRTMEISLLYLVIVNVLTLSYLALSFFLFENTLPFGETKLLQGLIGGLLGWLFFFCLVYFSHEKWMGWGDVWLGLLIGLSVGYGMLFITLTLAFGIGAIVGIALMQRQKKGLQSEIPFAPFLIVGLLLALVLDQIWPTLFQFVSW